MAAEVQQVATSMHPLPLLADATTYDPFTFDLYCTRPGLPHFKDWIEVFRKSLPGFCTQALTDASVPEPLRQAKAEQFAAAYNRVLDGLLQADAAGGPRTTCKELCELREQCLRDAGFGDIFAAVKHSENDAAMQLLPALLAELDAVEGAPQRMELALRGIFAGNVFDLGAAATVQQFESGGMSFRGTREGLLPRPWVVDHLEAAVEGLLGGLGEGGARHKKALLFVDNAGSDVVLGMLPFARELVKGGSEVVLAANEVPSINDITARELRPLLQRAGEGDAVIGRAVAEGVLRCISSGSADPVIHLGQLGPEVVAEAATADLVVLEGMGRAIETNLLVDFRVDALKVGMVKHPEVALCLGGRLYDCVCRWDPSTRPPGAGKNSAGA